MKFMFLGSVNISKILKKLYPKNYLPHSTPGKQICTADLYMHSTLLRCHFADTNKVASKQRGINAFDILMEYLPV